MFCQMSTEEAMAIPIAGMVTTCRMVDPTPYDATASVPKLATRNDIITSPSARDDISNEEGNPRKNALFTYSKSGRKSENQRWIGYFPDKRKYMPTAAAIPWVASVANAAHETPIAGTGPHQKMNRGSRT